MLKLAKDGPASMGVHTAMKHAGFDTAERQGEAYRRQVYRRRQLFDEDKNSRTGELFPQVVAPVTAGAAVVAANPSVISLDRSHLAT